MFVAGTGGNETSKEGEGSESDLESLASIFMDHVVPFASFAHNIRRLCSLNEEKQYADKSKNKKQKQHKTSRY